jgi:hypothetical protein
MILNGGVVVSDTGIVRAPAVRNRPSAEVVPIDPLSYQGWDSQVSRHHGCSFFHLSDWARVLQSTYGHRPVYCCRFVSGQIESILPVMEVSSTLNGRRGVALPFTDFCDPLASGTAAQDDLYASALDYGRQCGWRSFEWRNAYRIEPDASASTAFWGHVIHLEDGPERLFKRLSSSVRRGVRKAEKARLRIEFSQSLESTRGFYQLHCKTRQRHGVPCQPGRFFENISRFMLANGHGFSTTAWWGDERIAAALFLQHGGQVTYKFAASDYAFQHLRPNNLVMWESIKKCSADGLSRLHLGRTSLNQQGLRRFKLGFGAIEQKIQYFKYDLSKQEFVRSLDRSRSKLRALFRLMPLCLLKLTGRLLYPHLA